MKAAVAICRATTTAAAAAATVRLAIVRVLLSLAAMGRRSNGLCGGRRRNGTSVRLRSRRYSAVRGGGGQPVIGVQGGGDRGTGLMTGRLTGTA